MRDRLAPTLRESLPNRRPLAGAAGEFRPERLPTNRPESSDRSDAARRVPTLKAYDPLLEPHRGSPLDCLPQETSSGRPTPGPVTGEMQASCHQAKRPEKYPIAPLPEQLEAGVAPFQVPVSTTALEHRPNLYPRR